MNSVTQSGDPQRSTLPEHDPLTHLVNRAGFIESARRALALSQRQHWGVAVIAINIDSFHKVNEDFGYDAGDEVLIVVADRLRRSVRQHDTKTRPHSVTRIGGDHFLVLCETVPDAPAASSIAHRIAQALSAPILLGENSIALSTSIGIALTTETADPQQFVLNAEAALRSAQAQGGDRHRFFDIERQQATLRAEALGDSLRRAVVNNEFRLMYQPKVSLLADRLVGFEALIRWHHPELGMVAPGDFIPAAESSGLIVEIGNWVFLEACRQTAAWLAEFPTSQIHVSINVSARQFRAGLPDLVASCLDQSGVPPSAVCVEMTETTVMDDIAITADVLQQLKRMGLAISIDDFGTGYSSLEYLHRLPIDEVKIDGSFIGGLGLHSEQSAIVASVISLAHAMKRDVVAEGVETADQLNRLRLLGCDLAQGYLIARPLAPEQAGDLLRRTAAGERPFDVAGTDEHSAPVQQEVVLIVDDAADVRQLAQMSLTAAGFQVSEADNGLTAVQLAQQLQPTCVLLDLNMPGLTGLEVCRELRSRPETTGCTIVMLTTSVEAADKAEAFLVGADDYIVKPFTPRDLVARLRAAIKRRRETVTAVGRQFDAVLLDMLKVAREQSPKVDLMLESEKLSTRQLEVLRRLLDGERVPTIAKALFVSQSTVRNHLSVVFQRMGVHSQEELIQLLKSR